VNGGGERAWRGVSVCKAWASVRGTGVLEVRGDSAWHGWVCTGCGSVREGVQRMVSTLGVGERAWHR